MQGWMARAEVEFGDAAQYGSSEPECTMIAPNYGLASHRDYRNALGTFPTGVAIMSTRTATGRNIGLTCNSFSSVSLTPPLILWSLSKKSAYLDEFRTASYFAVNVLAADQLELSRRFASRLDRFAGIAHAAGAGGVPLIEGAAAHFECAAEHRYDGGDHLILIGRVVAYAYRDAEPLVYHRGQYTLLDAQTC
jgi:flavin reductase (DIM6/NTAB) family NADH-FMN oxidoreductase RutF